MDKSVILVMLILAGGIAFITVSFMFTLFYFSETEVFSLNTQYSCEYIKQKAWTGGCLINSITTSKILFFIPITTERCYELHTLFDYYTTECENKTKP